MIQNDPYTFLAPGQALFTVTWATSTDDDYIMSIALTGICSSTQWTLDLTKDNQPIPGARVCGFNVATAAGTNTEPACPLTYTFAVNFAGTAGPQSCIVDIWTQSNTGSATGYQLYQLDLFGSGAAPRGISVNPDTINFQDVPTGTTGGPITVTVTNDGSGTLSVTGSLVGAPPFAVAGNYTSFQLGSGSSAQFNATCVSPTLGPHSGTLSFTSAPAIDSESVTLDCNGINSSLIIMPQQVNFDPTLVGRAPPNEPVTIDGTNGDTINLLELDTIAMGNGVSIASTSCNPVPCGIGAGGHTVTLAYTAAAMHANGPLGVLRVRSQLDGNVRNVGINGEALRGGIGTNPTALELGAVCAGAMGREDVEVFANEAGNVILQGITPPAAPFNATVAGGTPKNLMGNHTGPSANVTVTLQSDTAQELTDKLVLTSNVPMTNTTEVGVHGVVLAAGIAATPTVVHFGSVTPGTTTSIKEVQLTNCGTTDLEFQSAQIIGPDPGEFTLIGGNPARTLHPTESEVFMVIMQPHSNGLKTAQLAMNHSNGVTTADLDGEGFGGETKDRETYYACGVGRPVALWPLAVALFFLLRRRRATTIAR